MRIGNGAADQLQLDIYGELIDSVYLYNKYGEPISLRRLADLRAHRRLALRELGPARRGHLGGARRAPALHVFAADVLGRDRARDRASRARAACPRDIGRWSRARDEIYAADHDPRAGTTKRSAFVQDYGADVLDASLLLMPLVKFIAPTDPRWLSTLDAIGARARLRQPRVPLQRRRPRPTGSTGDEGTFSICSFWYVEALARAGRLDEARLAFEKMLTYANHLGLYAEEIGASGEALGNFPQAFTHLALISAAVNLDQRLG